MQRQAKLSKKNVDGVGVLIFQFLMLLVAIYLSFSDFHIFTRKVSPTDFKLMIIKSLKTFESNEFKRCFKKFIGTQ